MNGFRPDLHLVVPVYNEAENFPRFYESVRAHVTTPHDITVVYDREDDTTLPVVREFSRADPGLILLRNLTPGVLGALKTGLAAAPSGAVVVTMADGSDDHRCVDRMYAMYQDGYDLVSASRYMAGGEQRGGPLVKGLLSRGAGWSLHRFALLPTRDPTNNFKLYRKTFLQQVTIESEGGFEIALELTVKAYLAGLRIGEVPSVWTDRVAGGSNFKLLRWLPRYPPVVPHGISRNRKPQPPMNSPPDQSPTRGEHWLRWVFGACLVHVLWAMSVGWNHSLLGLHAFRQTQTAMAVENMLAGSSLLRYETPFLGVPWSIPFELPVFQWIVAAGSGLLGTPVAQTARLVSVAFFLATLAPLISLQNTLGIRDDRRLILPSLLLVSPIYIFWSRAVMIESTALFFATAYLALLAALLLGRSPGRARTLCLAAACGAVAAMVKITTFATFLLAAFGLLAVAHHGAGGKKSARHGGALLLGLALPVLAGLAWTRFAEAQRELNPLAREFLTGRAMSTWFLGTIQDRFSLQGWETTLTRTLRDTVGNWGVLLGALFLSFSVAARERRLFLLCLALFLSAPVLILHLHRTHEYYPYANAVFLLAGVAWVIAGALEGGPLLRRLGIGLFVLALFSGAIGYRRFYHRVQVLDVKPDPGLVTATQRFVGTNGVLMIFGSYWSSEIPYYLRRRAIMNRDDAGMESPSMRRARESLSRAGYQVEGLLACYGARVDTGLIRRSVRTLGFVSAPFYRGPDCDLYGMSR